MGVQAMSVDEITAAIRRVTAETLDPLERWAHQCHGASLKLVSERIFGQARVARGACSGVGGQHSWVVIGDDCYDRGAVIVDPTLWSYRGGNPRVWVGSLADGLHTPHGSGSIWAWGRPNEASGPVVELTPRRPFSPAARMFLDLLGPLDREGWIMLAHAPMQGWPAAEIIDAICETPDPSLRGQTFQGYVPVDVVGMLTDRNPSGLYLP
jgi:hypothetical protein